MFEPLKKNNQFYYPVMEHFYSLQGEGFFSGTPAYFIRLSGCDIDCWWCDVKESWNVSDDQFVSLNDLINTINLTPVKRVVITGGEPTLYNLEPLTKRLKENNLQVHIETSGAYPLSGNFDWVCVSPKRFKLPIDEMLIRADELKMIIVNRKDLDWAEALEAETKNECSLFLQPEWSRRKKIIGFIMDYLKANPEWCLSLQVHKYLNIP